MGNLPTDQDGRSPLGVWVPNVGIISLQGGTPSTDGSTPPQASAPLVLILGAGGAVIGHVIIDSGALTETNSAAILAAMGLSPHVGAAVAPWGTNPAATAAAGADTLFKWGAAGTTPVNHVSIQNNSAGNAFYAFDQSSVTAGDAIYVLAPGQIAFWDRTVNVLHVSTPAAVNFGGQSGISIEGFA